MNNLLPVVVFAFNRPHKLSRVLEALRPQSIDRLIVFIDGERDIADRPLVESCRLLAQAVDWAPLELHFLEHNHGLSGFVENISLVMSLNPWAVFVEDDCLPMPGFYKFMRRALSYYIDHPVVFSICGYQPLPVSIFKDNPNSVISCARFYCWGWATWRERWQALLPDIQSYSELFDGLCQVPDIAGSDLTVVANKMASGQMPVSWDIMVAIACLKQQRVSLLATRGLIRNIGLDRSGVHGSIRGFLRNWIVHNRNVVEQMPPDLNWLADIQYNVEDLTQLREYLTQNSNLSIRSLRMKGWDAIRGIWKRYI